MTHTVSVYNQDTHQLESFEVNDHVYMYITQLEMYIRYPHLSGLKKDFAYGFRFPDEAGSGGTRSGVEDS